MIADLAQELPLGSVHGLYLDDPTHVDCPGCRPGKEAVRTLSETAPVGLA